MKKKIKIGLLVLIAGIVVSGFSFESVSAIQTGMYDAYDVKCKILKLEVVEEETPESYGEAKFTLEIVDAKLIEKGNLPNEIPPIKSGDIIEVNSYYGYKYSKQLPVSITPSIYNPSEFKEGDIIRAGILYAGLDSSLLSNPKHINDNYYIYAILLGTAILIISFAFVLRRKRRK